ncbi:hypothetical protein FNV43_RR05760 [Rhamnella rubrinervis]|uniref:Uncharacterized protein n=1 Tax=Rhamnella rubrinervis TaxID=2594499 RepID=A0A8K0HLZ0_9ROSA|nr:hypothetical protein FNV43_RR05760 [Rhamnella rubrinervis]
MVCRFKARKINWPIPKLSKDKSDDDESSEISFGENKPEEKENNFKDKQNNNLSKDVPPTSKRASSLMKDSFIEVMKLASCTVGDPNFSSEACLHHLKIAGDKPWSEYVRDSVRTFPSRTKFFSIQLLGVLEDLVQREISNSELTRMNLGVILLSNNYWYIAISTKTCSLNSSELSSDLLLSSAKAT